ncbi:YetF domain-containing protein [Heyndrickxia faecalis]|uniref:DUF421 domain-containing protein n=1 Tax=Heyndrickxia TaxID=2837504 RepID=UPI000D726BD4|nr:MULTISPECIES: YetF domain-containing protein [Heyndrickxia]NWN94969.1 DUF421 domain-containing protein [Bacillus sp. (in: firmicutes)]AWP38002.1 DUF421 domain-containing protein [Heyndrickxia coagulans]MEC2224645.1 DUF421 domain-containing protein [Weizmannia sp. CD-2023]MED4320927.1 DUF421 domain-containing protein [Weizmannia sp. CD-2023]MED4868122.1 DUF421 domain-containing protein [Weizmannia sp. CD-2023]
MQIGMDLLKLIMGFLALIFCLKCTGAKSISNLTPIDFIWSIMLSEIVGNSLYDPSVKWYYILAMLSVWVIIKIIFDILIYRYDKLEKFLIGDKTVIIDKGKINKVVLKKNKIDMNQLSELLRKQGVFLLDEIDQAYLEKDGTVTVKKRKNNPSK